MGKLMDVARTQLEQLGWAYETAKDRPILKLMFTGRTGRWLCFLREREEQHQLLFYSVYPKNFGAERRAEAAAFLAGANFRMFIGAFEMDLEDGNVRLRTGLDVEGTELTPALFRNACMANVAAMDKYLPGLESVLQGASAKSALTLLEEPSRAQNSP